MHLSLSTDGKQLFDNAFHDVNEPDSYRVGWNPRLYRDHGSSANKSDREIMIHLKCVAFVVTAHLRYLNEK